MLMYVLHTNVENLTFKCKLVFSWVLELCQVPQQALGR